MTTIRMAVDDSWAGFMEVLNSVPEDKLEEAGACGDWSIKDLMAHMAYWDDRDADVVEALSAGADVEPIDWQEVNTQEAALRAHWTLEDSRRAMHAAHERALTALARHPELETSIWNESIEHYNEHAADVRKWLQDG